MASSGTIGATTFETYKVIEEAYQRCKLMPQAITSDMVKRAEHHLFLCLSSLPARIYALWCQDTKLLAMPFGQMALSAPTGTIDIRKAFLRTLTRYTGTATSSAGGTASYVNDADLDTVCVQTSANGSITLALGSSYTITTVGIASASATTLMLAISTSADGSTFTTRVSPGATAYSSNVIQWYELDPAIDCTHVKITETGGATLSIAEFVVGNTSSDVELARVSDDSYHGVTNRHTRGRPTQFWLDRQASTPKLRIWPTADATYQWYPLVVHRQRHIEDVGTLSQTLEIPQRAYDAIVSNLALRLARYSPQVNPALVPDIKQEADEAMMWFASDERDASDIQATVNISAYTR
jgi:hypothetical protein